MIIVKFCCFIVTMLHCMFIVLQLMKDAKECLNFLSAKLGDKQYFHGDKYADSLQFCLNLTTSLHNVYNIEIN